MLITGSAYVAKNLDAEKVQTWKAIADNAAIGYVTGDELVKVVNIDPATGAPDVDTPYTWLNVTQETVLTGAPVLAEIEKADQKFDAKMEEKFHTDTTTGEVTEVYEVVLFNEDGTVNSTSYILADGTGAAFTPTGTIADEQVRVVVGDAVVAVDDTAVVTLTAPANTAGAHIQVHTGADIKATTSTTDPVTGETGTGNVVRQGQEIILHSAAEVTNFKMIGLEAGLTGEVYVEFFNTSMETGI